MAGGAGIIGWGTAVPDARVTNDDLAARVDTNDAWIVERTGIRERRVAGPDETTASLGAAAATEAIKRAGLAPTDIDLLIVATATPEQPIPHTGAFVGDILGLRCGSFDLSAACAGFVYALVVGASMLHSGYENILVVGSETLSRIVDPDDRTTIILFGDGAGAAVLAPTKESAGLRAWDLGCDGSAAGILEIPAGGSRRPTKKCSDAQCAPSSIRRKRRWRAPTAPKPTSIGSCRIKRTHASSTPRRPAWASEKIARSSTSIGSATRRRHRFRSRCSRQSTKAEFATATSSSAPASGPA
jgi:3-oxoacyl-[acyl-carrier-protein] synthase III